MKTLRGLMNLTRYGLWLLAFMLVAMAALAALLPSYPSQAKYVLNTITVNINLASFKTVPLSAIGSISGTPRVQETLTAGAVSPSGASVTYQWQKSDAVAGTYIDIPSATNSTYTLAPNDYNQFIRLSVSGTGIYTGTLTSDPVGPVAARTISIPAINGVTPPVTGATAVTSLVGATEYTATISWSPAPIGGIFQAATSYTANITVTPKTGYTLTGVPANFFTVAGTTSVSNLADSGSVTAVFPPTNTIPLTSVAINGIPQVGQTLTAALTPSGAIATYQWQTAPSASGPFTVISGATSSTYPLTSADLGTFLMVTATGTGSYSGTVTSTPVGPILTIPLTSVSINGTPQFGQNLTAALTPSGATATYQWQRSATSGGTYTSISGATSNTYLLLASDINYYIKVTAIGNGNYSGTVISAAFGPVLLKSISIAAISGVTVPSAGATASMSITPSTEYSGTIGWSPALVGGNFASGTVYTATITITPNTGYTLTGVPSNFFTVAGATSATNAANSGIVTAVFPSTATPITAIGAITGTPQVGQTLTAGAVTPAGATVTYQWQRNGTAISGATSNTYTLTEADANQSIRVAATGTGNYYGTVTSTAVGPITPATVITNQTITGVAVPVQGDTAIYSFSGTGYTATIDWNPDPKQNSNKFKNGTAYTATITITTTAGYTLAPGFSFTVPGATTITTTIHSPTSATVVATFPST